MYLYLLFIYFQQFNNIKTSSSLDNDTDFSHIQIISYNTQIVAGIMHHITVKLYIYFIHYSLKIQSLELSIIPLFMKLYQQKIHHILKLNT